jgi:hypothetical protein
MRLLLVVVGIFLIVLIVLLGVRYQRGGRGVPFVRKWEGWSIGLYSGPDPLSLTPMEGVQNPVLTAEQVTDRDAQYVADPFLIRTDTGFAMFFEVLADKGDIAVATSEDGRLWEYQRVVLHEPFHLSYPHVFAHEGTYFMIPESYQAGEIRLYQADDFPYGWRYHGPLVTGGYLDPTPIHHEGRWYLLARDAERHTLRLFHADDLFGEWQEHPASPVVTDDPALARTAGRITVAGDRIFRFAQDSSDLYGLHVWALEVTELTPDSYREELVHPEPLLTGSGKGWNAKRIHQLSPLQTEGGFVAAVDGYGRSIKFGLSY